MKIAGFFLVLFLSVSSWSQEKPLSEKEWKARCVQAKKQTEALLATFAEHDALVLTNYRNIFALSSFKTRYEEYKQSEQRYQSGIYKLWVLGEDTTGYRFTYLPDTGDAEKAAKLSDSLYQLKRMREFRSLADLRMKFDYIATYKTLDYNFIVTEYGILDKELNKQLDYAAHLIRRDTVEQAALLQRNMDRVLLLNALNQQTNTNIHFCLEGLKARYLENPEGTFPAAYDAYFSAYRETAGNQKGSKPVPDYFLETVDEPASFPGGQAAFQEYVDQHLRKSGIASEGCSGLKLQFKLRITRQGFVYNVENIENNPEKCVPQIREVMLIVKGSPDWFPAKHKGKPVSSVRIVELVIK